MRAAGTRNSRTGNAQLARHLHRRSPDKDVFPGLWDCWAGGVVAAGETPAECAFRELDEELGVYGVELTPVFTHVFEKPPYRCHNFTFEARWDRPIVHQAEEIVDGRWITLAELREWAEGPDSPMIPDGRAGILEWFRRHG
ncbi:NUDIX domain-containing protein [Amycolatopsis pithecellobii]|uniref:NUDIX domain-containing protein n=1 Tax=Amycolatopsis pithecellobii TaxID=664692 RepID=A0A6N7Z8I2_9PSEU|nr:NUDIX domain-containing protein [Amycolatopsis pithecellobii]MTD56826.1 NUDIX domain-containing protein [Amycolatopsis pithecellobii]